MNDFCLVFDLSYHTDLKYHIPKALIAKKDKESIGYIAKNANPQTLNSYEIESNGISNDLLVLCDRLNPNTLHKKYNAKNRTPKSLKDLLNEVNSKKIIHQYIQALLKKFLNLIADSEIPLSINLEKSQRFEKCQVFFSDVALAPKLFFHKKEDYMEYRLSLFNKKKELIPIQEQFTILLNEPSYVLHNKTIHTLKHINANKLKPFFNKEVIQIPNRSSVEYFNKFIKKVIKKAPIEAEGFEVITYNTCKSCIIKPTTTIFNKVYFLELQFVYENHIFSILDTNKKHIKLNHDKDGEFTVFETKRNFKDEENYAQVLKDFGIEFMDSKLAGFNTDVNNPDIYHNISKLIEVKDKLKTKSIRLDLELHRLKISDNTSSISTQYQEKNDWFDVEMTIETGRFQFPFAHLVSHLKTGRRLYELPNGSHFLIPLEWFSRFNSLVNLGKREKNSVLIQKNQFTLLEETEIATEKEINKDIVAYQSTGNLKGKLRNYQKEGVNWLVKNYQMGLGSCLADDMGLGKTLQSLAYLDFVYSYFEGDFKEVDEQNIPSDLFSSLEVQDKRLKALIVSPSSLTFNWHNETQKFCPHFSSLRYVGSNRQTLQENIPKADLVFTSYGILLRDIEFLKTLSFNFLIIDESQQIKNRNSKIYKAINSIHAKHKVSLSGTPIENSLSDLWSQMQFINPNLLGNYRFFDNHFKKPIEKEKHQERLYELKSLINPYLLRRTKPEVAKDLPELSEQLYHVELASEQAKLYEKEKSKIRNHLLDIKLASENNQKKNFNLSILKALLKLRQLANHPKLIKEEAKSGKFEVVSTYLETLVQAQQKTLIFSSFTSHLKIYTDWCEEQNIHYNLLTGKTKPKDREKEVTDFENNDENMLFFISIKAGGTGLNLTKASYVLILDPWWNPFAELQAIGRAHRIGQTQKVNVVRFISKQTIEEKINQLQKSKKHLSESILESQISNEIFNHLDDILN